MPFNNGDKAFIKKVYQSKNATFRRYWQNFRRQTAKKTEHVIKRRFDKQSTDQKHESDTLTHAHNEENVTTVKELVAQLRQKGQKQTHPLTSQLFKGTDLTQCSIVQIIYCVFAWSVFCLPTRILPNIAGFPYIYILQGSVVTQLRCGGIFNNHLIANCALN